LDLSWFGGRIERQYALSKFNIKAEKHVQFNWLPSKANAIASNFSRRYLKKIMGVPVWNEPHFHYAPEFSVLSGPVFLNGYWQSERYFSEIESLLLKDFLLTDPLPAKCAALLDLINSHDAICIHVRRGDYLSNPVAAKVHGTCSVDYYQAGVNEICQGLSNPHCFVFSDDPSWAKANLALDAQFTVVDVNGPNDAHYDLVLMAACAHYVIANSSLSWWGAWLGRLSEKKVIAPARWFLSQSLDTRDICPKSWHRR